VFIKLQVFTGGTITNSYAESINSRLRDDVGLSTKKNKVEAILGLRGYCKFPPVKNVTLTTANIRALQMLMQDDVIDTVSNGVLKQQLSSVRTELKRCEIVSETKHQFLLSEDIKVVV